MSTAKAPAAPSGRICEKYNQMIKKLCDSLLTLDFNLVQFTNGYNRLKIPDKTASGHMDS